jgi:hypothetical protein
VLPCGVSFMLTQLLGHKLLGIVQVSTSIYRNLTLSPLTLPKMWYIAILLPLLALSSAWEYAVKTPPLDTDWTYKVGTSPWPEYPRPQLTRDQWKNLNGLWTYRNAESLDEVNNPPTGDLGQGVLIPSCLESGLSGRCISSIA